MRKCVFAAAIASAAFSALGVRHSAFQDPLFQFSPVQPDVLSASGTFVNAFADYDSDGDLDLFVGLGGAPNRLYRNDPAKGATDFTRAFVDVAPSAGLADARATRAAAWGDFDHDGDPDLLVGFTPGTGSVLRLYRNVRERFVDVTSETRLAVETGAVRQPIWVDFDGDDDLDLHVVFRDRADMLFRNEAGKAFTEVAESLGLADTRRGVGAVWFDYDEDGDLDVYVAHMDGDANALYRREGGRFRDAAEATGLAWGGRAARESSNGTVRPCAADINNDGHLDLYTANYGPNGLFLNQGGGRFEDVSQAWGIAIDGRYDTCAFADIDNDGRVDLYVNGTVTGGVNYRDYLFRNTGTRFVDVTPDMLRALNADHGAQWADVDSDGDVELALTGVGTDVMPLLFRNGLAQPAAAQSVRIRVLDQRGRATRAGAEVRVFETGKRQLLSMSLVDSGSGYDSQNDMPVNIGLPRAGRVDVEVVVPRGGRRASTWLRNVDSRRLLTVRTP
ncbi:MAG TPA: CRTAC1 family protein [Vicinamibacterales bacterium]|nr:CRTAC1 family protein [Vicinamibacterales bacterium]